jgi:hypothetical protein
MLPTLALGSVVALIMGATCLTIDRNFLNLIGPFPNIFNWEQLLQKSNTWVVVAMSFSRAYLFYESFLAK